MAFAAANCPGIVNEIGAKSGPSGAAVENAKVGLSCPDRDIDMDIKGPFLRNTLASDTRLRHAISL